MPVRSQATRVQLHCRHSRQPSAVIVVGGFCRLPMLLFCFVSSLRTKPNAADTKRKGPVTVCETSGDHPGERFGPARLRYSVLRTRIMFTWRSGLRPDELRMSSTKAAMMQVYGRAGNRTRIHHHHYYYYYYGTICIANRTGKGGFILESDVELHFVLQSDHAKHQPYIYTASYNSGLQYTAAYYHIRPLLGRYANMDSVV